MENEIRKQIVEIFESSFDENAEIDFTKKIRETGINSINFIKNIVAVETKYDIEVDDDLLSIDEFNSMDEFLDELSKYVAENSDGEQSNLSV